MSDDLTRPIIGIENRTAQEAFNIMVDRITRALPAAEAEPVAWRWRAPGATLWFYDPTPEWFADHRHEIEAEPLYTAPPHPEREAVAAILMGNVNAPEGAIYQAADAILALLSASEPGAGDLTTDKAIDLLTDGEGDTVTFCAPNPDFNGLPNECVIVNASWTGWQDWAFRDDTRAACLSAAVQAMRAATLPAAPTGGAK